MRSAQRWPPPHAPAALWADPAAYRTSSLSRSALAMLARLLVVSTTPRCERSASAVFAALRFSDTTCGVICIRPSTFRTSQPTSTMFDFHSIRLLPFRVHRAELSSLPDIGSRLHSSSSPLPLTALRLGSRGRLLKWLLPSLLSLPPWPTRARNSTLAAASSSAVAPTAISITTPHVAAPPPRPPSGFGAACTGSMGHWCVLLKSVAMHSNRSVLAHPFHSWVRVSVDDGGIGGDGGADGGGCSDGSSESNTSSVVEAGHVIRVSLPAKSACSRSSCRRLNFPAS